MYAALKYLVLPPGPLLLAAAAGLALTRRRRDGGWWLAAVALGLLYALSTPVVAAALMRGLEREPPLAAGAPIEAGAIVVLSADAATDVEYGGSSVGPMTLARLRYGARLAKATGLPVLVSGGVLRGDAAPIADAMKRVLETEFDVPVAWVEDRSGDTWENAAGSAAILRRYGIGQVYLVSHAWHLARARLAFEHAGLAVVAAPTEFAGNRPTDLPRDALPSARALQRSHFALYELIGGVIYALRRRLG